MIVVGYDPGVAPTLALVSTDAGWIDYADRYQTAVKVTKTKWTPVGENVARVLRDWHGLYGIDVVVSEKIGAWTGQGLVSTGEFIGASRLVEGIAIGIGLPVVRYTPAQWKGRAGLTKRDKDYSRKMAAERWPTRAGWLTRKLDHDRAEAALLGWVHLDGHGRR